mgnify:CR=1 FL=1
MRYLLDLPKKDLALRLLTELDQKPSTLPVFPESENLGLVVAQLVSGTVVAEVIPRPEHVVVACGGGVPLGRLYFQISKNLLYKLCPELTPEVFSGGQ